MLAGTMVLSGCSGGGTPAPSEAPVVPASTVVRPDTSTELPYVSIKIPSEPAASDLGIVRSGRFVKVGDDAKLALATIPQPKGAFRLRSGIPIRNDDVEIQGWESTHSSFAILTAPNGRVILALYSLEQTSNQIFNEVLGNHISAFGQSEQNVYKGETHYHFWNRGATRLMVATSLDGRGRRGVYVAVGQYELMNAIGMSQKQAELDATAAQAIFERRSATTSKEPQKP